MNTAVMINLLPNTPIEFQLAFVEILCFMERDGNADLRVLQNLRMGKNTETQRHKENRRLIDAGFLYTSVPMSFSTARVENPSQSHRNARLASHGFNASNL